MPILFYSTILCKGMGVTILCYSIQGVPTLKGGCVTAFLTYVKREVPMLFYSDSIVLKGRVCILVYSFIIVQGRGVELFYSTLQMGAYFKGRVVTLLYYICLKGEGASLV